MCRKNSKLSLRSHFSLVLPWSVCKIDLVLLVDRSGSIGKDRPHGSAANWLQVKSFLVNLVENLDVGTNATRVALVAFSNKYSCPLTFLPNNNKH